MILLRVYCQPARSTTTKRLIRGEHHVATQLTLPLAKVMAVKNLPIPKTVQEVSRFLGMANDLSRFIPNLSQVAEPLNGEPWYRQPLKR